LLKAAEGMDQNHPAVLKEFALTYEQMGLTEKAREYWQRIVNAGSAKSGNYYGLAQARLARLGVTMPSLGTSVIADPLAEARASLSVSEPEPPPLSEEEVPPAKGNVWKVLKVDGRDYVTGQSIQLFYRFSTHKVDGRNVWFRNPNLIIKGEIGSNELLVNNIKFILSYPVLFQGGQALFSRLDLTKLIEPVIRPSYIGSSEVFNTVVLDAGHGGSDSGAKGVYGYEKNYALAMVQVVREALVKRGFKVVLTRSDDTLVSEDSRVALANQTPESIFISIHFNEGAEDESGIETFALAPQGSSSSDEGDFSNTARLGNQFDSENIALATAVHAQVVHRFKLIDRGIKRSRSTELTGLNRPGILFKGGFVTNKRECQLIASDQYRKALAEAIGDAVTNYRKALAPKPAGLLSSPKSVLSDEPSEND
jgi:N-acetylmuramoyl-L-alanine amidase